MTTDQQMKLAEFIAEHELSMEVTPATSNPNADDDTWSKNASHWLCTIRRSALGEMSVPFSQGAARRRWSEAKLERYCGTYTKAEIAKMSPVLGDRGLGGPESIALRALREECSEPTPPALADVLNCLALDASSYDNARNFEEWASELGMDPDSRKGERTYHIVAEQAKELRHLLGKVAYDQLLYRVDRE